MQTLDVISVNLWQIIISLTNLAILFLILKRFLFKPVKEVLNKRQETLDNKYIDADKAVSEAEKHKKVWEEKLNNAENEADAIIKSASDDAKVYRERIIAEAKDKADGIIRQAQSEAELERRKAEEDIRCEIIDVSAVLTEKMLRREINIQEHHYMIDSFIKKMGDSYDRNE